MPRSEIVIAATNYTVIWAAAVTGATAVMVGLIGYFSTHLTAEVTRRQIDAETERLKVQYDETHFQQRQDLYHDILNREHPAVRILNDLGKPREERLAALLIVREVLNGALLLGTHDVASRAAEMSLILPRWRVAAQQDERLSAEDAQGWLELRRELINAMRSDVSADKRPVQWSERD